MIKHAEILIAPLLGAILAIIFSRPKSLLDAVGRLGIGVFSGVYFTPLLAAYIGIHSFELQSGIAAGLGLFGFFMVEAIIRILNNIQSVKDLK